MKKYIFLNSDSEEEKVTPTWRGPTFHVTNDEQVRSMHDDEVKPPCTTDPQIPGRCSPSKSREEILHWVMTKEPPCFYYYQNDRSIHNTASVSDEMLSRADSGFYFKSSVKECGSSNFFPNPDRFHTSSNVSKFRKAISNSWNSNESLSNHSDKSSDHLARMDRNEKLLMSRCLKSNGYSRKQFGNKLDDDEESLTRTNLKVENLHIRPKRKYLIDECNTSEKAVKKPFKAQMEDFDSCSSVLTSNYIKAVKKDSKIKRNSKYVSNPSRRRNILFENTCGIVKISNTDENMMNNEYSPLKENLNLKDEHDNMDESVLRNMERQKCISSNKNVIDRLKNITKAENAKKGKYSPSDLRNMRENLPNNFSSSRKRNSFFTNVPDKSYSVESPPKHHSGLKTQRMFNQSNHMNGGQNQGINNVTSNHMYMRSVSVKKCNMGNGVLQIIEKSEVYAEKINKNVFL